MADTPDKLEFIFTREDDYRIVPCNGAWAGVTAQGEVKIDFFVECPIVPASVVFGVTPSDGLEELERKEVTPQHDGIRQVERRLQVGVLLKTNDALAVARLLTEKADLSRKLAQEFEKTTGKGDNSNVGD